MTGHEPLLKMRRAGKKPACVWVTDEDSSYAIKAAADWHLMPNPFTEKLFAHIHIKESDVPEALDFRCLVGLTVHMECERGSDRAQRLFKAIVDASPAFVISVQDKQVWTHGEKNG